MLWIPNVRLPPSRYIFASFPHIDASFASQNLYLHLFRGSNLSLRPQRPKPLRNLRQGHGLPTITSSRPSLATNRRRRSPSSRVTPPRPRLSLSLRLPLPLGAPYQVLRTTWNTIPFPLQLWTFLVPFPLLHPRLTRGVVNERRSHDHPTRS